MVRKLLTPLRNREFRYAWLGQTLNITGDAVYGVAVALFLVDRPDAATAISTVLAATALGSVVTVLFGGVLADRHRRSRIILISDTVRLIALTAILLVGPNAPVAVLALPALVMGFGLGLYRPAYGAILPSLLPADLIPQGNALRALSNRMAAILGAALGGVLVAATSARTTLVIDLVTFLLSIVTLLALRDPHPRTDPRPTTMWQEFREGLRYVGDRAWMTAIMLQGAAHVALVTGPVLILLPLLLGGRSAEGYGLVVAAEAGGAFAGAAIAASWRPARVGHAAMLCLFGQLPQLLVLIFGASLVLLVPTSVVAGAGLSAFGVIWISALQITTPGENLGRVMSVDALANSSLTPVGLSLSGWLYVLVGPTALAAFAAVVLVVSILAVLPVPGVADFRDQAPEPEHQHEMSS